jgi:hypothetical protein
MVIRFFCIHQSHKKRTAPTRGLSSGHHVQEAIEALQTAFRWKILFFLHAGHFSFVQTPHNGTVVLTRLKAGQQTLPYITFLNKGSWPWPHQQVSKDTIHCHWFLGRQNDCPNTVQEIVMYSGNNISDSQPVGFLSTWNCLGRIEPLITPIGENINKNLPLFLSLLIRNWKRFGLIQYFWNQISSQMLKIDKLPI